MNRACHLTMLAAVAALVAAIAAGPAAARAPRVLATIPPVHALAAMVMGGTSALGLLVKGGADPHGYKLRPSDARLIQNADVIFWIGPELETALVNSLATLARRAHIVSLSSVSGIKRTRARVSPGQRHSIRADPHIWLDPGNAASMVRAMARTLAAVDRANAAAYAANAKNSIRRLTALDRELRDRLANVRRIPYVVFHDAYRYFEQRYGLNSLGAVTTDPDQPPGARRLRAIQRVMIERKARCMFVAPGTRPAIAEMLRRGTAARIAVLDPLGAANPPGPGAYGILMRSLAAALTDCLSR